MRTLSRNSTTLTAIAIITATAVSACGREKATEASQVVARVDDSEITISQLRAALASRGDEQPTPEATRKALEGLVNEQLLVDAALRNKFDRDPVVVQALEGARRQLLARAYLERTVFPKQDISATEQNAYYKNHPALFGQREVYQLKTFTFPTGQLDESATKDLDAASSADAVAAVLAAHRVEPEVQALTRAAEQLPLEQLQAFASAEVGDTLAQATPDGRTTLTVVTDIHQSPLGFESAQPIIQQYLANLRNAEALDAHLRQARSITTITYPDASLAAATPVQSPAAAPEVREASVERGAAFLN